MKHPIPVSLDDLEESAKQEADIKDIISQYAERAIRKNYVVSFSVIVEIKR